MTRLFISRQLKLVFDSGGFIKLVLIFMTCKMKVACAYDLV